MTNSVTDDLIDIIATLKDEVISLREDLQTTREQVALLSELADANTPKAKTFLSVQPEAA